MAQTPHEIVLDVRAPGLKEYIRDALESAWEDGFSAATATWLYGDDDRYANPFRKDDNDG